MSQSTKIASRPYAQKTGYLPSLDGWRAVAILAVLMAHDLPWSLFGHSNEAWKSVGVHGVQLFFAISGVLITTRILEEESLAGFFDIKRFYIRRIFRIQPAALAYLTVTGLLIAFRVIHDLWHFWLAALLLYENYAYRGIPVEVGSFFSAHFWTLAVEEHFYILLSIFLFSVRRYRLAWILAFYAALILAQQYAIGHGYFPGQVRRQTQWQLHFLIFPAAFAVALRKPGFRDKVERWLKPWSAALVWVAFVVVHRLAVHHSRPQVPAFGGRWIASELESFVEIFFTLLVVATMLHKKSWTTRTLELAPLRFIGRISYSIYLWHLLFFSRLYPPTNVTNPVLQALSGRPMKYIAALSVAVASYYLIEKPMMRLGHRLAPPILPGRPELVEEPEAATATGSYSLPKA
jgi:peptidoglycan/LPS O-acetylase OafA/YrhL